MNKLFIGILIIVMALAGGFIYFRLSKGTTDANKRQAVFLTNGQVYFGHIQNSLGSYLVMTDIYYLKTNDYLTNNDKIEESTDKKISIIKLGAELHGPEDKININKDQVLFFENMKDDSKVNEAIKSFLANKKKD